MFNKKKGIFSIFLANAILFGVSFNDISYAFNGNNLDFFNNFNTRNFINLKDNLNTNDSKEDKVLEITLSDGQFIPVLDGNPDMYETIKVTTLGGKNLDSRDYTRLRDSQIPNIDLSMSYSTYIPEGTFKNATYLKSFSFPEGVRIIEDNAFYGCTALTGDLLLPNSITTISSNTFTGCDSLENIVIRVDSSYSSTNYRKDIIDLLPDDKALIDLSYNFDITNTWMENTNKKLGIPIIKDIINGEETDLIDNVGHNVSLCIPAPYKESKVNVYIGGEKISLPKLNEDNKYIFSEVGDYKISITTRLGNVSNITFNIESIDFKNAEDAVKKAEETKDVDDIEFARDLVNKLPESIKKDQFQNILDIISPNMDLPKESFTSNFDIYIKYENMISLGLNTSFIIFEDYSGIEDMEKLDAVTLNVDSSLPYEVNAYLSNEIQNSDKTQSMNKEILNIRENNDNTYKNFKEAQKVILKDNNEAGYNKVHNIDLKLKGNIAHEKGIYKAVIKFEVQQK